MAEIRSVLESLNKIIETPSEKLVDEINSVIDSLSSNPTRDEIESAIDKVENIDAGSIGASAGYKEREFLGRLAEKLGVRGLYTFPGGRTLVSTNKDERGNYNSSFVIGAGDLDLNKEIAEISLGLFPRPRLNKIRKKHPDEEIFQKQEDTDTTDNDQDNEKDSKGKNNLSSLSIDINLNDPQDIENKTGDLLGQYRELIRKMNESVPVSIRGYLKEYGLMLEDLSRDEALRLQGIYKDLEILSQAPEVSDDIKDTINSEIENAPEIARGITTPADRPEEIKGEPLDADDEEEADDDEADDEEEADDEPSGREPSGSLAKFAKSGEKGLANNPEEKETIEELQQFLTNLGYDTKGVDGIYGGGTTGSVKQFQEAFGLTVDGDAGPNTIQKIQEYRNDMEQLDMLLGRIEQNPSNNQNNNDQSELEQNIPASGTVQGSGGA
jgi:hypothetical protein